jgi:hypothetical protein
MTNTKENARGMTKYQGRKRGRGVFECDCKNSWYSASAWANTAQRCRTCWTWTLPFVILEWKPKKREAGEEYDPDAKHDTSGCQMCHRLGKNCIKTKSPLSKKVSLDQRKAASDLNAEITRRQATRTNNANSEVVTRGENQRNQKAKNAKKIDQPAQTVTTKKRQRNSGNQRQAIYLEATDSGNRQQQVPRSANSQGNHPSSSPQNPPQPKNTHPHQKQRQQLNNQQAGKGNKPTEQAKPANQKKKKRASVDSYRLVF